MMPHVSTIILLAYIMGVVYLIIVGFLGSIYGEPLGFLFLTLGITAGLWFYSGTAKFFKESN